MQFEISGPNVIVLAVTFWFVGDRINRTVPALRRYNIPVAVTGGLLFSLITLGLNAAFDITFKFDTELRDLLLVTFFATIGLSARLQLLFDGGKALVALIAVVAVFLVIQDVVGIGLALILGEHPGYGLFGGSVSLAGGHGTAIAWGRVAEEAGLLSAQEIGLAFATFGLIMGGLIGGPIAERLIRQHRLSPEGMQDRSETTLATDEQAYPLPPLSAALGTLLLVAICVQIGEVSNSYLSGQGITVPGFLSAMMVGIVIGNIVDLLDLKIHAVALESVSELSLQLFLAISLMSIQIWVLAGAIDKIVVAMLVQTVVTTLFATFVVFRVMGRNYDSAIIASGFAGLGMGATPVGIANMNAVTSRYGPSPKAFLIVPLVGAFFLDLLNALIVTTFFTLPMIAQPLR